jgi:hypothetical protein
MLSRVRVAPDRLPKVVGRAVDWVRWVQLQTNHSRSGARALSRGTAGQL